MKTAGDFFAEKNGGKTAEQSVEHGEFITATWAVLLMKEYASLYASSRTEELRKELEIFRRLAW